MSSPDPAGYLLDLDGTLYTGDAPVPGAVAAIARLRASKMPFRCVTNTTSRSRAMLVERLGRYGFDIVAGEIFTATLAGAAAARELGCTSIMPLLPAPALADLGEFALIGGTSGNGRRSGTPADGRADAVLVGDLGEAWSYAYMQEAFTHLLAGAALIACSKDRFWHRGDAIALDCGPFVAGLEYATGRDALVAGKPSPTFFASAVASLALPYGAPVALIGDDVWSDIAGAQRAGLQGWLVRTGKFRPEILDASGVIPDRTLSSIADLTG